MADKKTIDLAAHQQTIAKLIAENEAVEDEGRTPHLDVALGGLRTAAEQLPLHGKALAKPVPPPAKPAAPANN